MSANLNGVDLNSLADDDLGDKTLVGDNRVRVLDEGKVVDVETNDVETNDEEGIKLNGLGYADDRNNSGSKNRVEELMARDDGWGMMNMVGRVLDGSFGEEDKELEGENASRSDGGINLVVDLNPWEDMIGELTFGNETDTLGTNFGGTGMNENTVMGSLSCLNVVLDGKSESKEVDYSEADVLMTEGFGKNQDSIAHELVPDGKSGINVVDNVVADVFKTEGSKEHYVTEGKLKYRVSDLVWGKVKSHPWWPGQICSPSDASNKAVEHFNIKKDCYLIAFFGDESFVWNEASKIKPFHVNFHEMEKQSSTEVFRHAVSYSLDELSRRVEFGLSCPCLPKEVREKVRTQVVVNAGIREECSRRDGSSDDVSFAASFVPGELFQFIESLAENPKSKTDRLQFTVMKAQLLGFKRWKGCYQLPMFTEFGEFVEDGAEVTETGERSAPVEIKNGVSSKKRKSTARNVSSRKRKPLASEKQVPAVMSLSSPSLQNADNKIVKQRGRKKGQKNLISSQPVEIISNKNFAPDELLLRLSVVAGNPLQGHAVLFPAVDLLREFRNSVCLEKSFPEGQTELVANKGFATSNLETADTFIFEAMEDTYWTDRIIQGPSQPQILFEPEIPIDGIINLDNDGEKKDVVLAASESGKPSEASVHGNEIAGEYGPTSLLLTFSSVESIPSLVNLNEIFRHFGTLKDSETKILSTSKRVKVVFEKRADAEAAFISTGKYRPFGQSLVSYRLNFAPTPRKVSAPSKKSKKTPS